MKQKQNTQVCLNREFNNNNDIVEVGFEVSVFRHGELLENSKKEAEEIQDILISDLKMTQRQVVDMTRLMINKKWTQERFARSYEHVLENCVFYPPKASEFLSFDKKVKFNVYSEICDKISQYVAIYFKSINKPLYITIEEQSEFNFPIWDEKYRTKKSRIYVDPVTKEEYEV